MGTSITPAWTPGVAFVGGIVASAGFVPAHGTASPAGPLVGLLVALVGLGLALGRASGLAVAWLAAGAWVGLTTGAAAGVAMATPFDADRPVTALVELTGFPRNDTRWGRVTTSIRARSHTIHQGTAAYPWRADLTVGLPMGGATLGPGARLRLRGFVRRRAPPNNGTPRPAGAWHLAVESPRFVEVVHPSPWWWRPVTHARHRIEAILPEAILPGASVPGARRTKPASASALVHMLVLGDSRALPMAWAAGLRRAGLAHVTAVSGLHVGVVMALALVALARTRRMVRLVTVSLLVVAYTALVGMPPSALRAAGMALLLVAALASERPPSPRNALAVVVLILVATDPAMVHRLGFQLSVAATAGILLLAPAAAQRWTALPRWLRASLATTVAAQVATLPWTLTRFALVAPLAPVLNALLAPWLVLTMVAVGVWTVVALASPSLAGAVLPWLDPLTWPLAALAAAPAGPWWAWLVAPSWPLACGVSVLGTLWLVAPAHVRHPGRGAVLAALLVVVPHAHQSAMPLFAMLDVGQGDALLVRDGRHQVLVDGGGWPRGDIAGRVLVPALAHLGVQRLDAIVLTHPDLDHCGGLLAVARYVRTARVWLPPGLDEVDPCVRGLRQLPGTRVETLTAGNVRMVGRWRLEVLHPVGPETPSDDDTAESTLDRNDRSLVLRASVHGRALLLTGDIESAGERALLARPREPLRADVLKLAHHGSGSSSGRPFLAAVRPRLALVSAGRRNRFGHPSTVVRERLEALGIPLLRTDHGGAIFLRVASNGSFHLTRPPW